MTGPGYRMQSKLTSSSRNGGEREAKGRERLGSVGGVTKEMA